MTQQEQILKTGSDGAYGSTMEALRRAEASLPDLTTSYDGEIRSLYEKIVNRPAFRYEAESDPLYGMYRDRYVREGSLAMRDTIGRSAALTGGYSSSYAQSVGQQQYDAYLQKLGDVMPELYGAALKRWQAEGEAMSDQLGHATALAQEPEPDQRDRPERLRAERSGARRDRDEQGSGRRAAEGIPAHKELRRRGRRLPHRHRRLQRQEYRQRRQLRQQGGGQAVRTVQQRKDQAKIIAGDRQALLPPLQRGR